MSDNWKDQTVQDGREFWDGIASKYAKSPIKNMEAYNRTLDRTRSYLSKDDRVLEVGCGTGSTALLLAGDVARIAARDISAKMIEIAKGKARDGKVENVEFVQEALSDATMEKEAFDAVLAFSFLHLLEDTPKAIGQIRERLKSGGVFISKTPCLADNGWFFRILIPVMRAIGYAP